MGKINSTIVTPQVSIGNFGFIIGAEDNTAGTSFYTSDQSGFAHWDYGRWNVVSGGTVGGTVYGTANSNDFGYWAPTPRVLNAFPISELVSVSIRRGRTRPDQYDDVGEMTVQVLNQTGSSDPDNNTGRYQRLTTPTITGGTAVPNYSTWLQPNLYSRFVWAMGDGTQLSLFTGFLESIEPTDDIVSTSTYTFVDRLALLGRATMVNPAKVGGDNETGNARLTKILQDSRQYNLTNPTGGMIDFVVDIQGFARPVQLGGIGDTALDSVKTVVNGEAGRVFCDSFGVIRVWDRSKMVSSAATAAGTFTDTPATVAGYGYDEIHTNQGQNFLYNSALVTAGTTVTATFKNDASIAQYGERRYEVDTVLRSPSDALALATFLGSNWGTPAKSVASLSLQAYAFSQASFDVLAQLDLQQSVRVYRKLPGGRVLDCVCVIEGIEIDITPENRRFTFYLSPNTSTTISW